MPSMGAVKDSTIGRKTNCLLHLQSCADALVKVNSEGAGDAGSGARSGWFLCVELYTWWGCSRRRSWRCSRVLGW